MNAHVPDVVLAVMTRAQADAPLAARLTAQYGGWFYGLATSDIVEPFCAVPDISEESRVIFKSRHGVFTIQIDIWVPGRSEQQTVSAIYADIFRLLHGVTLPVAGGQVKVGRVRLAALTEDDSEGDAVWMHGVVEYTGTLVAA